MDRLEAALNELEETICGKALTPKPQALRTKN
jgi:hypothetical protein